MASFNLDPSDVYIGQVIPEEYYMPYDEYFALKFSDNGCGYYIPKLEESSEWHFGEYNGKDILVSTANEDLFMITHDTRNLPCILHYVRGARGMVPSNIKFKRDLDIGINSIFESKGEILMRQASGFKFNNNSNINNNQNMQQQQQQQQQENTKMNAAKNNVSAETSNEDMNDIQRLIGIYAKRYGYVEGFIMRTAPAISMKMKVMTESKKPSTFDIVATQSRPSGIVRVIIALPSCICMSNGSLQTPNSIIGGNVDISSQDFSLTRLYLTEQEAHAYISAVGGMLPELKDTFEEKTKHPSPEAIANGENLNYIYVGKSRSTSDKYCLKTSSPRKSILTANNLMCLRGYEHISIVPKDERSRMELNEIAFRDWQSKTVNVYTREWQSSSEKESRGRLTTALEKLPSLIWKENYEIEVQGVKQTIEGFGSAFFYYQGDVAIKTPNGGFAGTQQLTYKPWYSATKKGKSKDSANEKDVVVPVTSIINKKSTPTTKNPNRMSNVVVMWSDQKPDPIFKPFTAFYNEHVKSLIMPADLMALASNSKNTTAGKNGITRLKEEEYRKITSQFNQNRSSTFSAQYDSYLARAATNM